MKWISTNYVLTHIEGKPRRTLSVPPDPKLDDNSARKSLDEVMRADSLMNHLVSHLPGHESNDIKIKLSAISAFASANIVQYENVAAAMESWANQHDVSIADLIRRGTHADAASIMDHVAMKVRRKQTSGLSKYFAYHNQRWPIYDGWVRCYIWANLLHIDSMANPPEPGWAGVTHGRELEQYNKYCAALDAVWNVLALPREFTPRQRDAVFWYRASRGGITVSAKKRGGGKITMRQQLRASV